MEKYVGFHIGCPLGDLRALAKGDTVWLSESVEDRPDWGRYLDALSAAIARGVDVRWVR